MIVVLKYLMICVEVISCILLIGIILMQRTKNQGIGLAFGSGMGETLFGGRVGNVMTKATIILCAIFLVNTTLLGLVWGKGRERKPRLPTKSAAARTAPLQEGRVEREAPPSGGVSATVPISSLDDTGTMEPIVIGGEPGVEAPHPVPRSEPVVPETPVTDQAPIPAPDQTPPAAETRPPAEGQ